jgi:hypothetical protein
MTHSTDQNTQANVSLSEEVDLIMTTMEGRNSSISKSSKEDARFKFKDGSSMGQFWNDCKRV